MNDTDQLPYTAEICHHQNAMAQPSGGRSAEQFCFWENSSGRTSVVDVGVTSLLSSVAG